MVPRRISPQGQTSVGVTPRMPRRNSILRTSPLRRTVLVRRQPSRQALRLPKSIFPQNPLPRHSPSRLRGEHAPLVLLEASAIVRSRTCALLLINTLRPLPATATMTTTTTTSPRAER
ncbi:hypothetical protein OH76DRAFT_1101161 [Lentinus brumalis]|uniref:Uncharacterized protein n=1 Tax=Lentinus brumalis TaxID=2498619 RepID=A0A371CVY7_9APHY|nr:hypothetical protein OH76DRAFT_1101161 [Polyporus brumalis]